MRSFHLERPGHRVLAGTEQGATDGCPVIYLHGVPGAACEIRLPARWEKRVRLLAFDRPGVGGSTAVAGYSLAQMADDIRAVADWARCACVTLLGFSGGGLFALGCAQRLEGRVDRVVGLGAPALHWLKDPDAEASDLTAGAWQQARRDPGELVWALTAMTVDADTLTGALWERLSVVDRSVLGSMPERAVFASAMASAIRQGAVIAAEALARDVALMVDSSAYTLSALFLPVHLLHGEDDGLLTPRHLDALVAALPGGTAERLPGEGHYSPLFSVTADRLWSAVTDHY